MRVKESRFFLDKIYIYFIISNLHLYLQIAKRKRNFIANNLTDCFSSPKNLKERKNREKYFHLKKKRLQKPLNLGWEKRGKKIYRQTKFTLTCKKNVTFAKNTYQV